MTETAVRAVVAPEITERHPDYVAVIVVAHGIPNGPTDPAAGDASEQPRPGEIVWRDDVGVTCRRWNWRQGGRTRLKETSDRAFFVFDRLSGLSPVELEAAVDDLEGRLRAGWPTCST